MTDAGCSLRSLPFALDPVFGLGFGLETLGQYCPPAIGDHKRPRVETIGPYCPLPVCPANQSAPIHDLGLSYVDRIVNRTSPRELPRPGHGVCLASAPRGGPTLKKNPARAVEDRRRGEVCALTNTLRPWPPAASLAMRLGVSGIGGDVSANEVLVGPGGLVRIGVFRDYGLNHGVDRPV